MRVTRSMNELDRAFHQPRAVGPGRMAGGRVRGMRHAFARVEPPVWLFGLSPVGYVLCNTFTMSSFVVPFFIAWAAKVTILRFFGHAAYRRSIPFFVGIALGDMVTQALWTIVGAMFDAPVYQFLS